KPREEGRKTFSHRIAIATSRTRVPVVDSLYLARHDEKYRRPTSRTCWAPDDPAAGVPAYPLRITRWKSFTPITSAPRANPVSDPRAAYGPPGWPDPSWRIARTTWRSNRFMVAITRWFSPSWTSWNGTLRPPRSFMMSILYCVASGSGAATHVPM